MIAVLKFRVSIVDLLQLLKSNQTSMEPIFLRACELDRLTLFNRQNTRACPVRIAPSSSIQPRYATRQTQDFQRPRH